MNKALQLLAGMLIGLFFLELQLNASVLRPTSSSVNKNSSNTYSITPVPEYEAVSAIIISEFLIGENTSGIPLSEISLEAGADVIILSNEMIDLSRQKYWLGQMGFPSEFLTKENLGRIHLVPASHESYWVRDFGPISGRVSLPNQINSSVLFDFHYRHESIIDDTVPYQIGMYLTESIIFQPFTLDGGNFLTNGSDCLMTDDFEMLTRLKAGRKSQFYGLTKFEAISQSLGCKRTIIFNQLVHEHIDMWAKLVSKDTVLVNEISAMQLQSIGKVAPSVLRHLKLVKESLDQAAQHLRANKFNVLRLPMPIPFGDSMLTYANSLLINGIAVVPMYRKDYLTGKPYQNISEITAMEKKVEEIYTSVGFRVRFINSDAIIAGGGALHCVATQLYQDFPKTLKVQVKTAPVPVLFQ